MRRRTAILLFPLAVLLALSSIPASGDALDAAKKSQAERIRIINMVKPSVVAVYARGGGGGGSGVVIDPEGYALTNFHVVEPTGPTMVCGLPDGVLYDAVLVGLDKVGDVALIKLMPKEAGKPFPCAQLGDSDKVKVGDWSLAMGNPFLLATDFSPSVSYGLISGVNRYQYPSGGFLEYTDCLQFDTTINPGNSGGPLFSMEGKLIGINGRGSFAQDKRFRINCGVGYAISINQIKNFMGHFRAGIETDHATLGATVKTENEDGDLAKMIVNQVLEDSDAKRRDVQENDQLLNFAGRPLTSVNQYKNILGVFPRDWRMPLTYQRGNTEMQSLVRLAGYQPAIDPKAPPKKDTPRVPKKDGAPAGAGAKFYKAKKGFANYYFNEESQKRVADAFAKNYGDFSKLAGDWSFDGIADRDGRVSDCKLDIAEVAGADGKGSKAMVTLNLNAKYELEPLKSPQKDEDLVAPPFSGGLMNAMYHYRRFLTLGPKGFEDERFFHGGTEPVYIQPVQGAAKPFEDARIYADVIRTEHAGVPAKWYFFRGELNPTKKDAFPEGALIAFEVFALAGNDPCEVYLHEYKDVNGVKMPHTFEVRSGDKRYALMNFRTIRLNAAK